MGGIATEYHEDLQKKLMQGINNETATNKISKRIKASPTDSEKETIGQKISEADIKEAIKLSKNSKAPGLDGMPYELYKLLQPKENKTKEQKESYHINKVLEIVFNDIEENDTYNERFTEGLMCLLYKKKDRREIENYQLSW
jgi:predicted protein tyrosine phosphatase